VSDDVSASPIGQNSWLVEEMYDQFLADPTSVSESWRDFFADYKPAKASPGAAATAPAAAAVAATAAQSSGTPAAPVSAPTAAAEERGEPLRGVAARIVANMEASLMVPTATSFREVPAKLLEVNRRVLNGYLGRTGRGKVSFTHLIGYAVVRAIADEMPVMNSAYIEGTDGKPRVIHTKAVGLGIAVDQKKADGSRSLLVPCIRNANQLDFSEFWAEYEDVIRKVRSNKLSPDDFSGVTVTLTNPGTIGTVQSVPRLMPGQGLIVGVGAMDFPTAFTGADPAIIAELGLSKTMTISSTYDHRIIQGAESGLFLKHVHELLMGGNDFYANVFRSVGVPYEAVEWRQDVHAVDHEATMVEKQMQVDRLITMHRVRGHMIADLDPLAAEEPHMHPELDPATYGLTIWDLDREFLTGGAGGVERMKLGDILHVMRDAYCRTVGIEFMHVQEPEEKLWIQEQVENVPTQLSPDEQRHILERLNAAEALEKFLSVKYLGQKRFGIEGAESAIPLLDALLAEAADIGMDSSVVGMAHRGRLNVLVNIVGKNYEQLFTEFEGTVDPDSIQGSGDVKYHLGQTGKFVSRTGNEIPIELAANPSHLEAVDPVVVGMARARMDQIEPPGNYPVLPILLHGDAAFAGQGVVAETLNLSNIKGYRVGGTIHVVINNQLGFTTAPEAARSSEYCTDVAKMVQAPIFHVNGDDPEAVVRVARLAFKYRRRWNKDVVIDMVCYRRHGHNEGDDPSYTQPIMYRRIDARRSVRKIYTERLVKRGDITIDEAEAALNSFQAKLQTALDETRSHAPPSEVAPRFKPQVLLGVLPHVDTSVPRDEVDAIFALLESSPDDFMVHPKLAKQFEARGKVFHDEGEVDWATAEAIAIGSMLREGTSVRVSGEDSRRGTFSQRHAVLVDYENGSEFTPLRECATNGARLWLYDSLLSEFAVLGYEYGYSVANKDALVVWEGQFGDFMNGAQVIIDQFIVAAEDKWSQTSGLVILLPHGYEGQGPEHSSGRIERFLTLCADDNIQVCNATSAAQYFHLLRRQMKRSIRKPLIVFTPKSLLRAKAARSPIEELCAGSFQEVLDDPYVSDADAGAIKRVVLASGKVAVEGFAAREAAGGVAAIPVALARLEQLHPYPYDAVASVIARYPNATEVFWLQEEPENMGPWNFVKGRLYGRFEDTHRIERVSRVESASPATGVHAVHSWEQADLFARSFGDLPT